MDTKQDVIIIGGGTAGVCAAIQSAREGVRTLLVEKNEILGGTITAGGVPFPGLFHAWSKQIIGGIGYELVTRCRNEENNPVPPCDRQDMFQHWKYQIRLNPALFALICDEELKKAGASVLLDTMCAAVKDNGDEKIVTLCTKEGLHDVSCRVLIDCTGDANAVRLAGYPVEKSDETQPATYNCRFAGYDAAALDNDAIEAAFDAAVKNGLVRYTDVGWDPEHYSRMFLNSYGDNSNHIYLDGVSADTSEGRTQYALVGRERVLSLYRFLRRQKGMEALSLESLAPECGIRETVRIRGKKTITQEDYLSGKRYGDDVCYACYPIDRHTFSTMMKKHYPSEGIVATIPRGAMLPEGSRNFLAAGRCISSDQYANSAVRVQAPCMAEGQAAGALAALAVTGGIDVEEVPMEDLYRVLEKNGAIVPK